jgi:RHS repeat-associated protein
MDWGVTLGNVRETPIRIPKDPPLTRIQGLQFHGPSDKNSPSDPCDVSPKTSNPVIIATGEKMLEQTDFVHKSIPELSFDRTYRSKAVVTLAGVTNGQWLFGYKRAAINYGLRSQQLGIDMPFGWIPDYFNLVRSDGSAKKFVTSQTTAGSTTEMVYVYQGTTPSTSPEVVTWNAAEIRLTDRYGRGYTFSPTTRALTTVFDRRGTILTYTYDAVGNVTRVTHAAGQHIDLTWNTSRQLASVSANGLLVAQYSYTGSNLTRVTYANGNYKDYFYEDAKNGTLLTGYAVNGSRVTQYSYIISPITAGEYLVSSSGDVAGESRETFAYTSLTTTVTSAQGHSSKYTFVQIGNTAFMRLSRTDSLASSTCPAAWATQSYDTNGNPYIYVDRNGVITRFSYDITGRKLEEHVATGTPSETALIYTYGIYGLATMSLRDATGTLISTYAIDYYTSGPAVGLRSAETTTDAALGTQIRYTYTYTFYPSGQIATLTTSWSIPGGTASSTLAYDSLGNLVSTTDPLGHQVQYSSFFVDGQPQAMVDANGVYTAFAYDGIGNLLSSTQHLPNGYRTVGYSWDGEGRVTDISYPDGGVERLRYSASGRVEYRGNAQSEFVHSALDIAANTATLTSTRNIPSLSGGVPTGSASGQFTSTDRLDSLNRLLEHRLANGKAWVYSYDNMGNRKSVTDPLGRITRYDYDPLNRLAAVTYPDGGAMTLGYDASGNLRSVRDPRGLTTSYAYDALGHLLSRTSPDTGTTSFSYSVSWQVIAETRANNHTITYDWDALGRMKTRTSDGVTEIFTYDTGPNGIGHLTGLSDASGQTSYEYTAAGELTKQTTTLHGASYLTSWAYDAAGHLQTMTYPDGFAIGYSYDPYGRPSQLSSNLGGTWSVLADSFLYQPATDRLYAWRWGNNETHLTTLDYDGRVSQIASAAGLGLSYGYFDNSTIASVTDTLRPGVSGSYGYDANDRLKSAVLPGISYGYSYDTSGNRTLKTSGGATQSASVDSASNRLLGIATAQPVAYGYDALGNRTSDGVAVYTHDTNGRLLQATTAAGPTNYEVNALNQRTRKSGPKGEIRYIFDATGRLLAESNASGSIQREYVWIGTTPIAILDGGTQVNVVHSDLLGTPRAVTDASGKMIWRWSPITEPFGLNGVEEDPDGNGQSYVLNLRFPGQYYDQETGLFYNAFRYYDPQVGSYAQSDPIGLKGGINTYSYLGGNPLSYVDPLGLARTTVDAAIEQAIRRGDVGELQTILEAANPEQASVIQRALTPARDLIRGQTRRSSSYASELEENSYAELCQMAKGKGDLANKASKMKKLIEQQERLMEKLGGK